VLESGCHEQLLKANGAYARMWRAGAETPALEMSL
jgi:ATP-binding cassette subfamily B protein